MLLLHDLPLDTAVHSLLFLLTNGGKSSNETWLQVLRVSKKFHAFCTDRRLLIHLSFRLTVPSYCFNTAGQPQNPDQNQTDRIQGVLNTVFQSRAVDTVSKNASKKASPVDNSGVHNRKPVLLGSFKIVCENSNTSVLSDVWLQQLQEVGAYFRCVHLKNICLSEGVTVMLKQYQHVQSLHFEGCHTGMRCTFGRHVDFSFLAALPRLGHVRIASPLFVVGHSFPVGTKCWQHRKESDEQELIYAGWGTHVPDFFYAVPSVKKSESTSTSPSCSSSSLYKETIDKREKNLSPGFLSTPPQNKNPCIDLQKFEFDSCDFLCPLSRFLFFSSSSNPVSSISVANLVSVRISNCTFMSMQGMEALFVNTPHLWNQLEEIKLSKCTVVFKGSMDSPYESQELFKNIHRFVRLQKLEFRVYPFSFGTEVLRSLPNSLRSVKIQTYSPENLSANGGLATLFPLLPRSLEFFSLKANVTFMQRAAAALPGTVPRPETASWKDSRNDDLGLPKLHTLVLKYHLLNDSDLAAVSRYCSELQELDIKYAGKAVTHQGFESLKRGHQRWSSTLKKFSFRRSDLRNVDRFNLTTYKLLQSGLSKNICSFQMKEVRGTDADSDLFSASNSDEQKTGPSSQDPNCCSLSRAVERCPSNYSFLESDTFRSLVTLVLDRAVRFHDHDLQNLRFCRELRHFGLGSPLLTDQGFLDFFPPAVSSELRTLDLCNCSGLTMKLAEGFKGFESLERLCLDQYAFPVLRFPVSSAGSQTQSHNFLVRDSTQEHAVFVSCTPSL